MLFIFISLLVLPSLYILITVYSTKKNKLEEYNFTHDEIILFKRLSKINNTHSFNFCKDEQGNKICNEVDDVCPFKPTGDILHHYPLCSCRLTFRYQLWKSIR